MGQGRLNLWHRDAELFADNDKVEIVVAMQAKHLMLAFRQRRRRYRSLSTGFVRKRCHQHRNFKLAALSS